MYQKGVQYVWLYYCEFEIDFSNYCLSDNCKVNKCKRKYHNKILAKFASNEAFSVTILRSTSR